MRALARILEEIGKRSAELRDAFIDHVLVLTFVPVAAAILVAIPLAVVVRDRPVLRSALVGVSSMTQTREELAEWRFDCLTCVAALGFGDIPPRAFFNAMKMVRTDGWLARHSIEK